MVTLARLVEALEARQMLAANPIGLTPVQVRHAYGFDRITFKVDNQLVEGDGRGQTIAIVVAYDAPTIARDLKTFNRTFGLPDTDLNGKFILTKATPQGKPAVDEGWALEASMDVQWAHAIAPRARILLVEAKTASLSDMVDAVDYARKQNGVVAVSMSWGSSEFMFQSSYNDTFTTPDKHIGGSGLRGGVTFIASSGDNGAGTSWPAVSPNVLAVGGTTLRLDSGGNRIEEIGWSGSGGGYSWFENTNTPDIAYLADPATGVAVYTSTPYKGSTGWFRVGGTSAGAPQWAGLLAIVNQGRALDGKGSLDGPEQVLTSLPNVPDGSLRDITEGSNGYDAEEGYDLVTGLGTPVANRLVRDLRQAEKYAEDNNNDWWPLPFPEWPFATNSRATMKSHFLLPRTKTIKIIPRTLPAGVPLAPKLEFAFAAASSSTTSGSASSLDWLRES